MMRCYLDSNLLVYYKDEDSSRHKEVIEKLELLIEEGFELSISPLVLDEFIHTVRVILRKKNIKNIFEELRQIVKEILQLPNLKIINPSVEIADQLKVIQLMEKYSLSPRDAYHILTIQYNQIDSFATFDSDFRKVFLAGLIKKV